MSKYIPGNQKHLSLEDRIYMENELNKGETFKNIVRFLCKDFVKEQCKRLDKAPLIDRVAYDLSYGNPELKQYLTNIYNSTPGYDGAMRKLQASFKSFFGSDDFTRILVTELNQVMTEMVNKAFIIIQLLGEAFYVIDRE